MAKKRRLNITDPATVLAFTVARNASCIVDHAGKCMDLLAESAGQKATARKVTNQEIQRRLRTIYVFAVHIEKVTNDKADDLIQRATNRIPKKVSKTARNLRR